MKESSQNFSLGECILGLRSSERMWAEEDFGGRYDCFDGMNVRLQQVLRQKMVQQKFSCRNEVFARKSWLFGQEVCFTKIVIVIGVKPHSLLHFFLT